MSFQPPRFRTAAGPRSTGPVLSVGRRVFVNSNSRSAGDDRVALTDEAGTTVRGTLADGAEVEILAWRPRGATGPRYRVHSEDGREGWLPADNLRVSVARVLAETPSETPERRPSPERDNRRRFGQSFDPSR
jgi:hypothetical protein